MVDVRGDVLRPPHGTTPAVNPSLAMTTQYNVIPFLQWYETHTMLRMV